MAKFYRLDRELCRSGEPFQALYRRGALGWAYPNHIGTVYKTAAGYQYTSAPQHYIRRDATSKYAAMRAIILDYCTWIGGLRPLSAGL
jgi:hypothetical protein